MVQSPVYAIVATQAAAGLTRGAAELHPGAAIRSERNQRASMGAFHRALCRTAPRHPQASLRTAIGPRPREPRVEAAARGLPTAGRTTAASAQRSAVLVTSRAGVARLARAAHARAAGHRHPLASNSVTAVLDLEEPQARAWAPTNRPSPARADLADRPREPTLGRGTDRGGVARPRLRRQRTHRLPLPPIGAPATAITDMAHVPT